MKSGIELIADERQSQLSKHGITVDFDIAQNDKKELTQAARELLSQHPAIALFPESWRNSPITFKMASKDYKDRLVIAGALIAAEIDRLQSK